MARADGLLLSTGTGALDLFVGGVAADMYSAEPPATVEAQSHLAMENQTKVLEAAGVGLDDVIFSTWYLTDIRDWEVVEAIALEHFGRPLPQPRVVEVTRLIAKQGVRVEPDFWATGHRVG